MVVHSPQDKVYKINSVQKVTFQARFFFVMTYWISIIQNTSDTKANLRDIEGECCGFFHKKQSVVMTDIAETKQLRHTIRNTMRCRYNGANFLQNNHNRQYIVRPWGRDHDDVIKWKHFPRYWPFVREIHRSLVNSPHKGLWRGALMYSL